jgi:hypothetical protein
MQNGVSTQLEAIDFSDHIQQLASEFQGRSWVLDRINRWLQQKDQRFFVLAGEPGVGKSAIAAHLIQTRTDIFAHHFCQLGVEETVHPSRVLRSLAAQLSQAPYYGDALLNTIKSTLSAEVDINIDKIEDLIGKAKSKVKRVEINHLKTSDIVNEFDILLRAPLAALPQFYKDKGENPPELAIIVIDGLDVAVTMEAGVQEDEDLATLFAALAEDESLPSWIRFIFTTRPDRRVLREFEPLKPYLIKERSKKNQADIHQYVNQRLSSTALQQQVRATPAAEAWVEQLTERSQGNFRYIKSLLDDLEAGRCKLKDLSVIPLDLKNSYDMDFSHRFPELEWRDSLSVTQRHNQILQALAETEHPLTEEQLATLTNIRSRQLRQDLWVLRQFFDVDLVGFCSIGERKRGYYETFTLFHHTLKEYLNQQSTPATMSTLTNH